MREEETVPESLARSHRCSAQFLSCVGAPLVDNNNRPSERSEALLLQQGVSLARGAGRGRCC
jgi:hypothetical protein